MGKTEIDKNKKKRIITLEKIDFTIRILELCKNSGFRLDKAIQILEEQRKILRAKNKEGLYSVTARRAYSEEPEVDDEILVVNSFEIARKIADAISRPIRDIVVNKKLTPLEKMKKISDVGERGRVYNKYTKSLVYEDKELIDLMKELLDSAENENLNQGS